MRHETIYQYILADKRLNPDVLDLIDEDDRLVFRMGHDMNYRLIIHQRVINYFEEAKITGYQAFKVSEYEFGMEF